MSLNLSEDIDRLKAAYHRLADENDRNVALLEEARSVANTMRRQSRNDHDEDTYPFPWEIGAEECPPDAQHSSRVARFERWWVTMLAKREAETAAEGGDLPLLVTELEHDGARAAWLAALGGKDT